MNNSRPTIPTPQELRQQIHERVVEVRALRRMLRLAEAAETAAEARARQRPLTSLAGESNAPR